MFGGVTSDPSYVCDAALSSLKKLNRTSKKIHGVLKGIAGKLIHGPARGAVFPLEERDLGHELIRHQLLEPATWVNAHLYAPVGNGLITDKHYRWRTGERRRAGYFRG